MENEINEQSLGYLRYEGELVEAGYLDIKKASEVLDGFDESLRFFLHQTNPELKKYDFEIPIRIRRGSWEALIPDNIDELFIKGYFYWSVYKYTGSALSKMAENDFENIGFKTLLQKALDAMQGVIKLANHVGSLPIEKFRKSKFKDGNKLIGIENMNGEILWVPEEYLDLYVNCPKKLFSKLTEIIENGRELTIGLNEEKEEKRVTISSSQKHIYTSDQDDEILFPELEHGDPVELEGHVTRGNESSNTIGFLYNDHILTCVPIKNNVKDYKQYLFTNCIMEGRVDRLDKDGNLKKKRPVIKFSQLIPVENDDDQKNIFNSSS